MPDPKGSSDFGATADVVSPEMDPVALAAGIFEHSRAGIAVLGVDGCVLQVNPALAGMLGVVQTDLTGTAFEALLHPEAREDEAGERQALLRGEALSFTRELRLRGAGEEPVWARVTGAGAGSNGDGTPAFLVYQCEDLSAQREARERVRRSQEMMLTAHKLEAVARLAGGVAHEFNNLLTGIRGYTRLLLEDKPLGHEDRDPLVKINRAVERATGLVAQLLAFGKQEFSRPEVLDLAELVEGSADLLRSVLGEEVILDVDHLDTARVRVDPRQFEQILVNLALNARDAMPEGGMVRLAVERARVEDPDGSSRVWGVVTMADTGRGMTDQVRDRIFEPFFSTRPQGQGLGLGLSAVHGIMEAHEGRITVESQEGRGTTFRLFLPVAEEAARRVAGAARDGALGPARILVVDDDESVREVAAKILRRLGYEVEQAGNASEALAGLLQRGTPPDLLLTDIVMPGMNGRELAEQVLKAYPGTRVLYMSAYTEDDVILRGVRVAEVAFLPKPFSLESLADAVQEVLEAE